MTTKLSINNLTAETLAWISGPRISSVQITDGNYNVLDDTAANVGGGYILINGNDFDPNPQVLIDNISATTVTRVSNSLIRAQIPPAGSASYNVLVINSDGSTAILVNGLTYSAFPAWITGSSLSSKEAIVPINIQLSANEAQNSAIIYSLAAANTLPTGTILYSNGYIQGRVTANANATYNFTVVATDTQNQDVSRAFSLPITLNTPPAWLGQPSILPVSQPIDLYSNTIVAVDPAIASYVVTSGSLPPGLTLDIGTGVISGRTSVGNRGTPYSFVVTATDTAGFSSTRTFSITVGSIGFNLVQFLLKSNADAVTSNNHTFVDSSSNRQITRVSTASQGSVSPFSLTGWSINFPGYENYITTDSGNVKYNPGATGPWTLETYVYPLEQGAFYGVGGGGAFGNSVSLSWIKSSQKFQFQQGDGGSNPVSILAANTSPRGSWYHVAICKDSNNFIRMFVDGTMVGYKSYSSSISSGNRPVINGLYDNNGLGKGGANCYVSNLRWVKGGALYDSNTSFTPPTGPLSPSVPVGNCHLLVGGTNNFTDLSGSSNLRIGLGTPSIKSFSPFDPQSIYIPGVQGGSGYFSGSGLYLTTTLPGFKTVFTVECWVYPTLYIDKYILGGTGMPGLGFPAGKFGLSRPGSWSVQSIQPDQMQLNTWNHVAWVRQGNAATDVKIFLNGNIVATGQETYIYAGGNASIAAGDTAGSAAFGGYIAGLHIVNGEALYTANTSPPTSLPTATPNTILLMNFTNASIYDATSKNNILTFGNVLVDTSSPKYSDSSLTFDGTGDYLRIPDYSGPRPYDNQSKFTIEGWIYPTQYQTVGNPTLFMDANPTAGTFYFGVGLNGGTPGVGNCGKPCITWYDGSSTLNAVGSNVVALNTWTHVAYVANAGVLSMFVNGVSQTVTGTTTLTNVSGTTGFSVIGQWNNGGNAYGYFGKLEDFRITESVLYTSDFIPPMQSLPAV